MADIESYEYLSKTKKKLKDTITFFLAVIILFFLLAFLPLKVFGYTGEISISDLVGILLTWNHGYLIRCTQCWPLNYYEIKIIFRS